MRLKICRICMKRTGREVSAPWHSCPCSQDSRLARFWLASHIFARMWDEWYSMSLASLWHARPTVTHKGVSVKSECKTVQFNHGSKAADEPEEAHPGRPGACRRGLQAS